MKHKATDKVEMILTDDGKDISWDIFLTATMTAKNGGTYKTARLKKVVDYLDSEISAGLLKKILGYPQVAAKQIPTPQQKGAPMPKPNKTAKSVAKKMAVAKPAKKK